MRRLVAACVVSVVAAWLVGCTDQAATSSKKPSDSKPNLVTRPFDNSQGETTSSFTQAGRKVEVDVTAVVASGNRFSFDLYEQLRGEKGNLFFSPASISLALAMTYAGAAGDTETEMAKTLHFQMPKSELHDGMAALQTSWQTTDKKQGFRLNVANRLWAQQNYAMLPEFLTITRNQYGAELARLDFEMQTEKARQAINGWVEDQTEKKIADLIRSTDIIQNARLVLTNAVYFKGDWSVQFKKKLTEDEDFHVSSGQTVNAPLMCAQDEFRYAEVDGLQILELPYGNKSLAMVVLLPEKVDGLGGVEAKLSVDNLQKWSAATRSQEVIVYLPKFKATFEFELKNVLQSMGMVTAFDVETADFSRMTGGKNLFISAVLHKAFVDVNEEGTEAAAATGVIMRPTSARIDEPKQPPVFRADHPFIFLIRDDRNGAIMFLGRVADPTK